MDRPAHPGRRVVPRGHGEARGSPDGGRHTLARSITFLSAAMGVVDVPGAIVEPVIAAVANLLVRQKGKWPL
ncbi:hypothetical protein ACIBO5_59365 [Nonomuraea angiospora]|uniref:hypothetical protein n=1 Tax=Nonomuraea angiospora TaxID=46172 RepID=UPI0037AF5708